MKFVTLADLDGCPEHECPLSEWCDHINGTPPELMQDPPCSNFSKDTNIDDVLSQYERIQEREMRRVEQLEELLDRVEKELVNDRWGDKRLGCAKAAINLAIQKGYWEKGLLSAWDRATEEGLPVVIALKKLKWGWHDLPIHLVMELADRYWITRF